MRVIKEAYVLQDVPCGLFMQAQGTALPKMFVSKATAESGAAYWAKHYNNGVKSHTPTKVFLVVDAEEEIDDEVPF